MTFEEYFGEWIKVIDKNEMNKTLNNLKLLPKNKLSPNFNCIFEAFHYCKLEDLKVVFIGGNPIPNTTTGLLFGNEEETPQLSIIKESSINFEIPHNSLIFDNSLKEWAKQGVLLLHSSLVSINGKGNMLMWLPFISSLLINLSLYETGIIYVLIGEQAQALEPYINQKTNIIYKENSPEYYLRKEKRMSSHLFIDINKQLKQQYGNTIKWYYEI